MLIDATPSLALILQCCVARSTYRTPTRIKDEARKGKEEREKERERERERERKERNARIERTATRIEDVVASVWRGEREVVLRSGMAHGRGATGGAAGDCLGGARTRDSSLEETACRACDVEHIPEKRCLLGSVSGSL